MKKILLCNQDGDGLHFKWLTTNRFTNDLDSSWSSLDGMHTGSCTFYVADILSGQDGDIDDMIVTIPFIYNCPNLVYDKNRDQFIKAL